MKIGLDSSVIVAAVHTSHPRHSAAARWLIDALAVHELVVCQHSILEAYAVLTRLPGDLRVQPSEARDLLAATVKANMSVTGFKPAEIWKILELLVLSSVSGGHSYDAFVAHALAAGGAQAVATLNPKNYQALVQGLDVISP
jgi:predicted nucleic acid-binding protein